MRPRILVLLSSILGNRQVGLAVSRELALLADRYDLDTVWFELEHYRRYRRFGKLDLWRRTRPHLLMLELYPFGRRQMRFELMPLLDAAINPASAAVPRHFEAQLNLTAGGGWPCRRGGRGSFARAS